jgi:glycosyltransferase involved in cell wall biosynthesis
MPQENPVPERPATRPFQVSFLVHCDSACGEAEIEMAKSAFDAAGFSKDCHYLFHGALVPVEKLMVDHGVRVFSSSVSLDRERLRKLAVTFAYFPLCCVIPLRAVSKEALAGIDSESPADWRLPEGAFAFNRLLLWQESDSAAGTPAIQEEGSVNSSPETPRSGERPGAEISVVIPTYNRIDILEKTLKGYAGQSARKDLFEIIVVDDGSTDSTWETLGRLEGEMPYRLRRFRQANQGPGQARNLAIGKAAGRLVLITGDDIIPHPDLIWYHLAAHKNNPGEGEAVLGKVDWPTDLTVNFLMHYVTEKSALQFGYTHLDKGDRPDYRFFYTSNISLKRNFLRGKTLFRPEFVHAAYEDIELGVRLQREGMRIVYEKQALGFHHHPMTIASFCKRQYKSGEMAVVFAQLHPDMEEEIGVKDVRENAAPIPMIRDQIRQMEDVFERSPFAAAHDRPYLEIPERHWGALGEYIWSILGAYYHLGVREALERTGYQAPVPAVAPSRDLAIPEAGDRTAARIPPDRGLAARLNEEGEELFGSGEMQEAVLKFCAALQADASFAQAYNNLGVAAWKLGREPDARRLFGYALQVEPGNESARENLAALPSMAAETSAG